MRIIAFIVLPISIFPMYFISFGTDVGIALGYDGGWYSIWGGYPYSGFGISVGYAFFKTSLEMSSRIFEDNLPGMGNLSLGIDISNTELDFNLGFSTGDSTIVGDSELVGSISFGFSFSYRSEIEMFFEYRSTVYGLYRKGERYYFGFTPYGEIGDFPFFTRFGVGISGDKWNLSISYTFRSGTAPGIPTPVIDIGGLALRIRVER